MFTPDMSEVIEFWSSGPMICCPLTLSRFPPEEFFSACCNHNSFGFVFWNICFSYVVFLAWILGLGALSYKVRQSILVQALSFRQDHSSLNNSLAKDVTSIAWKRLVFQYIQPLGILIWIKRKYLAHYS